MTIVNGYGQVYTVLRTGNAQTLGFNWAAKLASYNNEIGYFTVKDATGTLPDGTAPTSPNYAKDALTNATVIFSNGQGAGTNTTKTLTGGQLLEFYLIQNSTTANFLANNPTNAAGPSLSAYFTDMAANPDGDNHTQIIADQLTGMTEINFEDLRGLGDHDYNDVVFSISPAGTPTTLPAAISVPANTGKTATCPWRWNWPAVEDTGRYRLLLCNRPAGRCLPATGTHTTRATRLTSAAALSSTNSHVLFAAGSTVGTTTATITPPASGTRYIAFYTITNGTTANFVANNPTKRGSAIAQRVLVLQYAQSERHESLPLVDRQEMGQTPTRCTCTSSIRSMATAAILTTCAWT